MKLLALVFALVAVGGLAAGTSFAQYRPAATQAVAKHPHYSPPATPTSRPGSIGGTAGKPGGIGGQASKPGGINGTVRPKH